MVTRKPRQGGEGTSTMALYHLILDADLYYATLQPALSTSWQHRSFAPCQALAETLRPAARDFTERFQIAEEPLLLRLKPEMRFDRTLWRALVGEALWFAAAAIPELQTLPATLGCLLAPKQPGHEDVPRDRFAPIQQAHFGSRDMVFGGGFYRPEHAGWNDPADVARLADYLTGIDSARWTPADLQTLPELADEEERGEELEFAREWFPALLQLYQQARQRRQVVVCETIE
jgi:hypothetical protein